MVATAPGKEKVCRNQQKFQQVDCGSEIDKPGSMEAAMSDTNGATKLTQSSLTTLARCEELYRLKYIERMRPMEENMNLSVGKAFHLGIEEKDPKSASDLLVKQVGPVWTNEDKEVLVINCAIVEAMVTGALEVWSDWPERQEVEFLLPLMNPATGRRSRKHLFAGKFDGLWPDRVGEWKSASRVDSAYIDRLGLDFQVSAYLEAASVELAIPVERLSMTYRVVKKPQIRPKSKIKRPDGVDEKGKPRFAFSRESTQEYANRVMLDYRNRPEFYFTELTLRRTKEQMLRWRHEAWEQHRRILHLEGGGMAIRNTSNCTNFKRCAFLDLCCGKVGADTYRVIETPHPELGA